VLHTLDKKWKELVFAASSFGPNVLMVLLMAYFTDAIYPIGLNADKMNWSITGYTLVYAPIFGLVWALGRVFDGIIDIPLASVSDNMRTRWGRRRPPIAVAMIPMILSYPLAWIPLEYRADSVANTFWMVGMLLIFYASYTMCLVSFNGSISKICVDEEQRSRVAGCKSFFDTIGFVIVYALLPIFIKNGINIRTLALWGTPLILTMVIPFFMIKEGVKYGEKLEDIKKAEKVPMLRSFLMCCKNREFLWWTLAYVCAFFGLQMFLSAQNTLISGVMNLGAGYAAILNTCAFAPVPFMLIIMYRLIKKRGVRFTYRLSLVLFAIAILNFNLGGEYLWPNSVPARLIIGCFGSVLGSFSIGTFFAMPMIIPSQISAMEIKLTGKDHTSMYFATQSLCVAIAGAVSTGIVYEYLKGFTLPKVIDAVAVAGETWKTGVSLVPVVVTAFCLIGFLCCGKMPDHYTEEVVKKSLERIR